MPKSRSLGVTRNLLKAEILIRVSLTQYVVRKRHLNNHT